MIFQSNLLLTQMALENAFFNLARSTKKPCVILCDRGAMDGSAYMDVVDWEKVSTRFLKWNMASFHFLLLGAS